MATTIDTQRRSVAGPSVLPGARGPISEILTAHLRGDPGDIPVLPLDHSDLLADEDAVLALYVAYELHYRSFAGVVDGWEWEPALLRERARLEVAFERRLRDEIGPVHVAPEDVADELRGAAGGGRGPSLSAYMAETGTLGEMREFAIHRSAYQLKEADAHTWAIPRLHGRAKAALVDIQTGEYGDGIPERVHATLFADTMDALDLDATYGAYLDRIPASTLATVNLTSLFGLHRRWRGAIVGHLALFEMCSVVPMGRYAAALRRLGRADGAPFYDVHLLADRRHEVVALDDMVAGFVEAEPELASDVVFGARALELVERRFADLLLDAWREGRTSLRSV